MLQNSKYSAFYIILIIFSLVLIFLESKSFFNGFKIQTQRIFLPLSSAFEKADIRSIIFQNELKDKQDKIKKLEEENLIYLSQISQNKNLEDENLAMRRLLGSEVPPSWKFEIARKLKSAGDEIFLSSNTIPQSKTLVLATQKDSTIKGGIYVGFVEGQIGSLTRVILPTHVKSKIPAVVRDFAEKQKKSTGILEGKGSRMLLTQILSSDEIKEGDLVLTLGEGQLVGQTELLTGKITKVIEDKSSAFKRAEVDIVLQPKDLDFVFFVTKK